MTSAKIKVLLTAITTLTAVTFTAVTAVFGWFNFAQNNLASIVVTTGNIEINNLTATAFKYVYPILGANTSSGSSSVSSSEASSSTSQEIYYDYDGVGTVTSYDLLTSSLKMNKYDPFYVKLNDDITVHDLMTNIAVKFTFTVKTYTNYDLSFNIKKTSNTTYGATNFIDFWCINTDYTTSDVYYKGTQMTSDNDRAYYAMKCIEENLDPTSSSSPNASLSPTVSSTNLIGNTDSTASITVFDSGTETFSQTSQSDTDPYMEKSYTLFFNFDYNQSSLDSYVDSLSADSSLSLLMNYQLDFEARQV